MLRALGRLLLVGVTCIACGSSEPGGSDSTGGRTSTDGGGAGGEDSSADAGSGNASPKGGGAGTPSNGDAGEGGQISAGASAGTGQGGTSGGEGSGGSPGGTSGGTSPDAGSGGEGGSPPTCPDCDGPCLEDGTCVECTNDTHCSGELAHCNPETHACVECLPEADDCADDQYCSDEYTCIPGCKNDAACGSGICSESHDCEHCLNDGECAEGRLCSTGVCQDACTNEGEECGEDRTCCGGRCVDTARDIDNCGACASTDATRACGADDICGRDGCLPARIASVCANARVAVMRGKAPLDFPAGDRLGSAFAACTLPPAVRAVVESEPIVSNAVTGQPFIGAGELLVVAGGPYVQSVAAYLEANDVALVRHVYVPESSTYELHSIPDGVVLGSLPVASVGPTHDFVLIEMVRDQASGTPVLIVSGFNEKGTAAGAWYFENVVMPSLSTYEHAYYAFEWTDGGDLGPDEADTFAPLAHGP